jgi:hypothetical protein
MNSIAFRVPTIDEIRQARKKRIVITMLTVFGDESADEKAQRVYTVAGIGGTEEEWDFLERVWLKRTGGKIFRPADCESDHGDYKEIPHEENQRLYLDIVNILARTKLMGYAASADLQALRDCFPGADEDAFPYFHCFSKVLQEFLGIGHVSIPQEKVKFSFHTNLKTKQSATDLYFYMLGLPEDEWKFNPLLADEISFIGQEKTIGIQAACLFSREAMKHFDNFFVGPRKRPIRESMRVLLSTKRYRCFPFDRKKYEELKREVEDLEKRADVPNEDYTTWMKKHRFGGRWQAGIEYLAYIHKLAEAKSLDPKGG